MKKKYMPTELEIILFYQDVITTSMGGGNEPGIDPDDPANDNDGIGGGDGYNPGGWT